MKKRTLYLMFTVILLVSALSACQSAVKPENVYRIERLELPSELSGALPGACCASDGMVYLTAKYNGEDYLLTINSDRIITVNKLDLEFTEGGSASVGLLAVSGERVWLTVSGSEPDSEGNMSSFKRLYMLSENKTESIDIGEGYISGLAAYENHALLIQSGRLKIVDEAGNLSEIPCEKYSLSSVFGYENLYVSAYTNDQDGKQVVLPIDVDNLSLGDEIKGVGSSALIASADDKALFYSKTQDGIYGYFQNTQLTKTELVNYLSSNIDSSEIENIISIGNDEFFVIYYDGEYRCGIMSPVPENEVPAKEIIKVAATEPRLIRADILAFNKQNTKYHVDLADYSEYGDTSIQHLNVDLASKNAPDILLISDDMNYQSMVSKNMFVDLYAVMDSDADFEREDYLKNIFEAYETDGKLYSLANRFAVDTYAAKKSLIGSEKLTTDGLINYADSHNISIFSSEYDRRTFVETYIIHNYGDIIKTGIDTGELRAMLAYAKTLSDLSEGGGFRDDTQYTENRVLLSNELVMSFDSFDIMREYTFGEDAVYVGFPNDSGNGSVILSDGVGYEFAIMNSSKHKDGAWEFVKSFLSEENQMPVEIEAGEWSSDFGFPILKRAVDKLYELAIDENVGGRLSSDEADRVYELISSVNKVKRSDSELFEIVYEEATAYFSGQKSIDEVIEIISNRSATLLAERE